MRKFIDIITETHLDIYDRDAMVAEGLPLTMALCHAQGYREGKDDEQFRQWCEERVTKAYDKIKERFRGDTIRIWRAITLPEGETPSSGHPGICWTWDEDALHPAHGRMRDAIWVYTGETTVDQIDWAQTLGQNAAPGYEHEREIRLIDFGQVDILDISPTGEVK